MRKSPVPGGAQSVQAGEGTSGLVWGELTKGRCVPHAEGQWARRPWEVRGGFPEERALQGDLEGAWKERAGRAEETACAKPGRLGRASRLENPIIIVS